MSWLKSLVGFENLFSKGIGKDILHDPSRLLTGVDPASTTVWNKVLGTDKKPLVNVFGSPGQKYYDQAKSEGIDTGAASQFHHVADAVAGYFGAKGLAGIGGGGVSGGETGGMGGMGGSKSSIVNALLKNSMQPQQAPVQAQMQAMPDTASPVGYADERVAREQMVQAQLAQLLKQQGLA